MDAFELLKADHKKVAELFDELEAASGQRKLDVFKQIKSELDLHAHVEETIFYPALEKPEETHDLTLEAYEEHKVIKTLSAELAGAQSADDEWQAQAKVLRENVEHHVDEEENELFDKADDALSSEQIEALGEQMEAEKARKQGKPAPTKVAKSTKKSAGQRGIVSKIANFVGLGTKKKAAKKGAAKKKTAAGKGSKARAKAAAKKSRKPARATTKKRGSVTQKGRERTVSRSTRGAAKRSAAKRGTKKGMKKATKKAGKKRSSR